MLFSVFSVSLWFLRSFFRAFALSRFRDKKALTSPMIEFETVALVGMGLMGGSLGLALRQRRLARQVVAVARRPETVRRALELGAADEGCSEPRKGAAEADLVVLCTPVLTMPAIVERIAPHLKPGAVVTDVGSTKAVLVRELPPRLRPDTPYLGGHPMAGSEQTGVDAARADLFVGASYLLTPTSETPEDAVARLERWIAALGAIPIRMQPEAHDRAVAGISHLPHVVAAALAAAVGGPLPEHASGGTDERETLRRLIAGGFRSTTRIAASSPEMWRDICLTNREAVLEALRQFETELALFTHALENRDAAGLLHAFERARAAREDLVPP
jgi:prephenate dehydrogenase